MIRRTVMAIGIALTCMIIGPLGCTPSSHERAADTAPAIVSSAADTAPEWTTERDEDQRQPQAMSLLGQPLFTPVLPPDVLAQRQEQLYEAQADYDRDLHDETAIIWLGRRQAYMGEYRQAIDTFSNGLAIMPESHRLLRHRGHRYITVREFDRAIDDLMLAAMLIEELDDEIEPDGQPNTRNIPTSTTNTNIFYHLGLAQYLKGEWRNAAAAFRTCFDASLNDDMRVASAYWLYLSLMRAEEHEAAVDALVFVDDETEIIENESYRRLLLVYRGDIAATTLQPTEGVANDVSIDLATIGYGLGMRDLLAGHQAAAERRFRDIIANTNWAAFGHIAAEAELARMSQR